ncbi:MAG: hypothetical protein K0U41_05975 [Gammaproteobacteria bacterium]|nr:hypothetical protein [Gammaproteobacteria bacterium]
MTDLNSKNRTQFISFDEMVRYICSYLGDDEASKLYTKVARFLGGTLDDFNVYRLLPNIKSVLLTIEDNLTVSLPEDFMEISKVGVCYDRELRILGRNKSLCTSAFPVDPVIECCTCEKENEEDMTQEDACCPACTFNNFGGFGRGRILGDHFLYDYGGYLYGYVPQDQFVGGTYDVDLANNRLILGQGCDVSVGGELVVEYQAGLQGNGYRLIPRKARSALMYKVAHLIEKRPDDLRSFKREYYEFKRSFDNYSLEDWLAAVRKGYHSAYKR